MMTIATKLSCLYKMSAIDLFLLLQKIECGLKGKIQTLESETKKK